MMPVVHQNRPRRPWPPYPTVEDEAFSLSREYKPSKPEKVENEAMCRGEIDQLPMIIEVNPPAQNSVTRLEADPSSSDGVLESSSQKQSSRTPLDPNDGNSDQRYIYIPEKGVEIPLTYDDPRAPKREKKPRSGQNQARGRQKVPKSETDQSNPNVIEEESPYLKRKPSPYAYAPKQSASEEPRSDDHPLSPGLMSPKFRYGQSQATYFENATPPLRYDERKSSGPVKGDPYQSSRSSINTQHSIGIRNEAASRSIPYPVSSDESDSSDDESLDIRASKNNGQYSPESPRKFTMPRFEDFSPWRESQGNTPKQAPLPSKQAVIMSQNSTSQMAHALPIATVIHQTSKFPQNPHYSRPALPLGSPVATPLSSPPMTPPGNRYYQKTGGTTSPSNTPPNSRPTSRASSPVQAPRIFEESRSTPNSPIQSRNSRGFSKPQSRMTSPLTSPGIEGAGYFSAPRIDVREPSPADHDRSIAHDTGRAKQPESRHGSLLPSAPPNPPTLQAPPVGGRRRTLSNVETRPNISINPPHFQQFPETLQSPRARSRPTTPTRAVSFGSQPVALPPCPRTDPVSGYNDWYNLVGFPSFAICPSCRFAVFSSGYEQHFTPSPYNFSEVKTRCGFSNHWPRMAWLLATQNKRPDANLIYEMAKIAAYEPPCPGKEPSNGKWFRIADAESGKQISNFDVCSNCIQNLETIFPTLRGAFQHSQSRHPERRRPCDLRSDSKRFPRYIDLLESIANQAQNSRGPPNLTAFTQLAQEMAETRECSRDDMLLNQHWHTHPAIPELTVCEECYRDVIRPAKKSGVSALASGFASAPEPVAAPHRAVSCQLYSPRLRAVFAEACRRNDALGLRTLAVQRHRIERELQGEIATLRRMDVGEEEKAGRIKQLVAEWKRWE